MNKFAMTVKDLDIFYGEEKILSDISLDIHKKAITAFIGSSGCGKSTLLRCFNRMNDYTDNFKISGNINIGKYDIYSKKMDVHLLRAKVGMVFQRPNPFPKSIYDNVAYGPRLHNMGNDKAILDEVVQNSLKRTDLWDQLNGNVNMSALKLSGGQQQRLCIARAIAVKPKILLMDEPCSALDPISAMNIENLILELKDKLTIVIVTHSMKQAKRIADYVAFFHKGRILEFGTKDEVFNNPKFSETKRYVNM